MELASPKVTGLVRGLWAEMGDLIWLERALSLIKTSV